MSIISSGVMGLDGLAYCGLGVCMLSPRWPGQQEARASEFAGLYPSLFKRFLRRPAEPEQVVAVDDHEIGGGTQDLVELAREDLGFRLLGYLVLMLGVCRIITSFYWGCGYVYLGLVSCLAEIGIVCNELLRHESMLLHRAMAVLLENMVLSLLYMSTAVPSCT